MRMFLIYFGVVLAVLIIQPTSLFAGDIRQERVRFQPQTSSATIRGSIKGYETIDYVLGAKAGQTMHVFMKTNQGANYFNVWAPEGQAAIGSGETSGNDWTGTLPVDGDYRVRVYLMRSAARRDETTNYTLTVEIAGAPAGQAPAGDVKVGGTPYHATGTVPCSFGPDPKGSAQCSFGVIRGSAGNAEVRLAPVGYDVTLHPDKVETVLIFRGNGVSSVNAKDKVTAEKRNDEWSIGVNDFQFYTIPEAVIVGG